jgi:hypothetical protein
MPPRAFGATTTPIRGASTAAAAPNGVGFGGPTLMAQIPAPRPFGATTTTPIRGASTPAAAPSGVGFGGPTLMAQIPASGSFSAKGNSFATRSLRRSRLLPSGQPGWGHASRLPPDQRSMGYVPNWHPDGEDSSWYPGMGAPPQPPPHPIGHAPPRAAAAGPSRGHTPPRAAAAGPSRVSTPSRGRPPPQLPPHPRAPTPPRAAAAGPSRGYTPSRGRPPSGHQNIDMMEIDTVPAPSRPPPLPQPHYPQSPKPEPDMIMLQSRIQEAYTIMYNMTIKIFIKIKTIYEYDGIYEQTNPGWSIREYRNLWEGEIKQLCNTLLWFRETILMKMNQLHIDMSIYRIPTLMYAFETIENICMAQRQGSTINTRDIYYKAETIITNSNYSASELNSINGSDYQQHIQDLLTAIDTMLQQNVRNDVLRFVHNSFRRAGRPRLNYNSSSHYKLTRRRQPRRDYKLTRRRQPRRDYKLTRRRKSRRDYKLTRRRKSRRDYKFTRRRQPRRDYKFTRRRKSRRDYKFTRRRKSRHTMITR